MSGSRIALVLWLVPSLATTACSASGAPPNEPFRALNECTAWGERPCVAEENHCRLQREWDLQDCWSLCPSIGDCSTCARLASDHDNCHQCHYDDEPARCEEPNFVFTRAADEDTALGSACRRYFQAISACAAVEGEPCEAFARVERPEMVEVYDCFAEAGCDAARAAACPRPAAEHFLSYSICEAVEDRCDDRVCSSGLRARLVEIDGWLRDDVAEAVDVCLEAASCDDYSACVEAWLAEIGQL